MQCFKHSDNAFFNSFSVRESPGEARMRSRSVRRSGTYSRTCLEWLAPEKPQKVTINKKVTISTKIQSITGSLSLNNGAGSFISLNLSSDYATYSIDSKTSDGPTSSPSDPRTKRTVYQTMDRLQRWRQSRFINDDLLEQYKTISMPKSIKWKLNDGKIKTFVAHLDSQKIHRIRASCLIFVKEALQLRFYDKKHMKAWTNISKSTWEQAIY